MPLGSRTDCGDARYAGLRLPRVHDIAEDLQGALLCGFDFLVADIADPPVRRSPSTPPPFTRSDLLLSAAQWSGQVVGQTSAWIDADAATGSELRRDSEFCLRQELAWAAHLSLQACLLPCPRPEQVNTVRVLNQALLSSPGMALWLQVDVAAEGEERDAAWRAWNRARLACDHSGRLGAALALGRELPSDASLARWRGEPVKAVLLPTEAFVANKRGYPVLPKRHQAFLADMFQLGVQVILSGDGAAGGGAPRDAGEGGGAPVPHALRAHWEYVSYLFRKMEIAEPGQGIELAYRDYLQCPLQPLQDNLESQTYEVFERDSIKYVKYEEAVYRALCDRAPDSQTVLMVVGAGRGPLVAASLSAAQRAERAVRVYAVEKNPNAIVTLSHRVATEPMWQGKVTLVSADMRTWEAPENADILVSELLGSFGDNELSPECLDGAQRFLKEGGVSIPAAYTSYLQPITAHKLWTEVGAYKDLEHFETPFVVKLHRFHALSAPQSVFKFEHPTPQPADNTRSITLEFTSTEKFDAVCHGFGGYFEAQLYADVTLSTHPDTHTEGMASWFPIYFPIRHPFVLPAGAGLQVSVWRCQGNHKVWYEWAWVAGRQASPIHNPNGRSYAVGL